MHRLHAFALDSWMCKASFFFVCLFHLASNVVKDCNELSSFLVHEKLRIVTKAQNEERLLYSIA